MSEHRSRFDEPVTPPAASRPTVVGVGASAGGLSALKQFFAAVPPDSGLAWVVVVHLSPGHESHLADLLQPHAPIPVIQVTEATPLEPNHVYVIPPDHYLEAVDSHLHLTRRKEERAGRAPVDHFFRTLAESFDGHAVAVILTGTGSDGAQGVRRIREGGGIVVAQDPAEAEFDGMPRSAIETGAVDLALPVADIPARILKLEGTRPQVRLVDEPERAATGDRELVPRILTQVRMRTGHDFSRYRRSTIERRVERRMQLNGIEQPLQYLEVLRESPGETAALADDLLINVTAFFRDAAVFEYLERSVIGALFEGKGPADRVRVWSVGCATGEEAYSLGMLLIEEATRLDRPPQVQIFASDLHERSLHYAREGLYPDTIAADVSPERLARFFQEENGGYRVRKELRERVVFAPHNLLRDPPFSHLDLLACRNVLIYLQRDLQDDVQDLFHYALHGEGYLLLGTAETVDRFDLFQVESKEHHIYRRRNVTRGVVRVPSLPLAAPLPPRAAPSVAAAPPADGPASYGALHQLMVERYAPPSILVDAEHNVLHLSEHAGRFLQVPGGLPSSSVFKLVREELRAELRAALLLARERQAPSRSKPIPVRMDGAVQNVVLRVSPMGAQETVGLALVIFDEVGEAAPAADSAEEDTHSHDDAVARELEAELDMTRGRLQALVEEFESSQEEMRASNEELQSANEELRSTMEELETSREELQSINEELQTLNQENRHKVEELSQLSSDLQNLLKVTDIATLFLDRALRINRFTPRVGELFNIRLSDRGRPLADLTHRLGYGGLLEDARRVLETLVPVEREVETEDSRWFLIRVLPYRTVEDRIEGVVITLVDVSTLKRAELALRESEEKYRTLFESIDEAFLINEMIRDEAGQAIDLRMLEANPAYTRQTGLGREMVGKLGSEILPTLERFWLDTYDRVARTGVPERVENYNRDTDRWYSAYVSRVGGDDCRVAVVFADVTARKHAELALRASEARQAFLLTLSDALTPLRDVSEIKATASRLLGEHLGVGRAFFAEIAGDDWIVGDAYDDGSPPLEPGHYPATEYGRWTMDTLRAGGVVAVADTATDPRLAPSEREALQRIGNAAVVGVPLVRHGDVVAVLSLHSREPRDWTNAELELVQEIADRTWPAVERARAEAALRASEEKFAALFAASPAPFLVLAPDAPRFTIVEVNDAYLNATMRTREDLVGLGLFEAFPDNPNDPGIVGVSTLRASLDGSLATRRPGALRDLQYDIARPDGTFEERWWSGMNSPVLDEHGDVVAIIHNVSDVTEAHRAEAALRASEERYRLIVEGARDYAILTTDPEGTITSWSPGAEAVYGWPAAEAVGLLVDMTFVPEDRAQGVPAAERAQAEAGGLAPDVRWHQRGDDERVFIDGVMRALRDDAGRLRGFLKVGQDVTRRRETEEALRTSEERYRTLVDNVTDHAIFLLDAEGYVTEWTAGAARVTGYAADEVVGRHASLLYTPEDVAPGTLAGELAEAAASGRAEREGWRVRRDGTRFWANEIATAVRDGEGRLTGFTKISRDLTERRIAEAAAERERASQARDELRRALSAAEEAERRRLARELHDQLGQQLTALALGLEDARRVVNDGTAAPGELAPQPARTLLDRLERLQRLSGDMTMGARYLALELRPPELDDMGLENALGTYVREWRERFGIAADLMVAGAVREALPPDVASTLYRIAQEALTNVAKHARATSVSVIVEQVDGHVQLIVEDDGRGMDIDAATDRTRRERRLGLAGMQERAALLGGEVKIESTHAHGTSVYVRLPLGGPTEPTRAPAPEHTR